MVNKRRKPPDTSAERGLTVWKTRWIVVAGGFLLAMAGGLSYSWGVFVEPMQRQFGWTKSDATLPLSVFMVFFALSMIPGGKIQEKISLRRQIRIGAFLYLLVYLLSALVHIIASKWWLVFSYGVLGGICCGLTYSCITPPIRRWFPDHPGLAVSLGVMGFGLATVFFAPFKAKVALPLFGIAGTFVLLGIVTFLLLWFASRMVRFPANDWFTHLFGTMHLSGHSSSIMEDVLPRQMLREKLFWCAWLSFIGVIFGSLMIIGILPSFGTQALKLTPVQATVPLSLFALINGLSRPLAGWLSDRLGALQLMIAVYILQTITFFLLPYYVNTLPWLNAAAVVLGLGIGVTLALYPVLSSEFFGVTHLGINYGLLFSAYGFGALAIPLGAHLLEKSGSFAPPLLLAGSFSALGTLILILILLYLHNKKAAEPNTH